MFLILPIEVNNTLKSEVKRFWNENPLYSFELNSLRSLPTKEIYEKIDTIKLADVERFSNHLWEFDRHRNERVLDIGCGPGYLVRSYARGGARIIGVDLSKQSVRVTHHSLKLYGLKGAVVVGDAENLPFKSNSFDFISSSGVLHHTPDTNKAITELGKVLKNGKTAVISLYYKNFLLKKKVFPLMIAIMKFLRVIPPGRKSMTHQSSPDEFIRTYDGDLNPVGKGYTKMEGLKMLSNFQILSHEIHFFPKRFIPFGHLIPTFFHKLLDAYFGTLLYCKFIK